METTPNSRDHGGNAVILFEDEHYRNLLPLVYWRTCGELRTGYGRLMDHALAVLGKRPFTQRDDTNGGRANDLWIYCRELLAEVTAERLGRPVNTVPPGDQATLVSSRLLLTDPLQAGPTPAVQWYKAVPIIIQANRALLEQLKPAVLMDNNFTRRILAEIPNHTFVEHPRLISYPWDLVAVNEDMLETGWKLMGEPAGLDGRICEGTHLLNRHAIYVGQGSTIKPGVVLDAENGPIYISDNVIICPNASIEGPCYIGSGSLVQPGAALRDAMSIGRRCKVGGELESSIVHGFSNKQHDGFLGHSYVAEWVNLAADTVNSDLKNTYGTVRVPINGVEVESDQILVGLTIGDHSKTGIGQMFPTGAVVGFGSNIATCEFAPKFVPSFTWLAGSGRSTYDVDRCMDVGRRVMARRQTIMTHAQIALFRALPAVARSIEIVDEE